MGENAQNEMGLNRAIEILTKCDVEMITYPKDLGYKIGDFDKAYFMVLNLAKGYDKRLKEDLAAALEHIQLTIGEEVENPYPVKVALLQHNAFHDAKSQCEEIIQDQIDTVKGV